MFGLFRALSRARGKRIFHPHGAGFEATFRPMPGAGERVPVELLGGGDRPALVRLSRGVGLPELLPDILGVGIRVPDAYGAGSDQDILLATSGAPRVLRHAIAPGLRGFFRDFFSTVLPYEVEGRAVLFGLRGRGEGPSPATVSRAREDAPGRELSLYAATPLSRWREVARLELGSPLPDEVTETLALTPLNSGGGLRIAPHVMALRGPAYAGSQAGRG